MSTPLIVNGVLFNYPQTGDESWGTAATGWAQAVTSGMLQKSGGFFLLTALVDFGPNFGIKVKSLATETANPSTAGYMALAKTDSIGWRNNANSGNLLLSVDGSDNLTFNGSPLGLASLTNGDIYVGNASNVPTAVALSGDATLTNTGVMTIATNAITNTKVSTTAAIATSKLAAQTASVAAVYNSSGFLTASATTATQISYLSTATSDIQAQITALAGGNVPAGAMLDFAGNTPPAGGWLSCDGSAVSRSTYSALFSAIGTLWGNGDGSTTFNIPDFRRRVAMGSGGSGTGVIGNAVGNTGGAETVTLTQAQLPVALGTASSVVTQSPHVHVLPVAYAAGAFNFSSDGGSHANIQGANSTLTTTAAALTSSEGIGISVATTITNGSGGNDHPNVQPSAIVYKIIKY